MSNDDLRMSPIRQGRWWRELVILVVLSIPFLFWGIDSIDLLDPDEGMYGAITREMAEGGNWITPHFNGVRYLEKPPLYFWLTAMTTDVFGPSEWVVRLWSALPALGTAILTWRLGGLLYGGHAGLLSAVVMMSGVGVFRYVRVPATDFLLVFSITLAMVGFVKVLLSSGVSTEVGSGSRSHSSRLAGVFCFYLGIALGVLSKGLIGLVFPLLIVGLYLLLAKASDQQSSVNSQSKGGEGGRGLLTIHGSPFANFYSFFANRYSLFGLLLFLVIVLPWHIVASLRNPGFFGFYIVDNQFLRFLNSRGFIEDDIPLTTLAFLGMIFIWFFPWSPFLPAAFRQGFPRLLPSSPRREHLRRLVGLWALTIICFFSLASSKLDHYFLPAITPLSLMVGALWAEAFSFSKSAGDGWASKASRQALMLKWCLGVTALGCLIVGAGLLLFSDFLTPKALLVGLAELDGYYRIHLKQGAAFPFESVLPFVQLMKGLGVVLVIGFPLAFIFFYFRLPKTSFTALLGVAGAIGILVFVLYLVVEPVHSTKSVANALNSRLEPDDSIVYTGALEYSGGLPFYTGRKIYILNGRRGDMEFGSRYPEAQYLFLDNEEFIRMWEGNRRVFLVTRFEFQDGVLKTLMGKPILFVGKYGSRRLYTNRRMESSHSKIVKSEELKANERQSQFVNR